MISILIINANNYKNIFEFNISPNTININNIDKILNNNNETSKIHTWEYNNILISLYGISDSCNDFNINLYTFPYPIEKIYGNCMLIAYDNTNNKYISLTIDYYNEFLNYLFNLNTQNSLITPTYDTDFSISFDDTKIHSSSVVTNDEETVNIILNENDLNFDEDNNILPTQEDEFSDLTLSDNNDDDDITLCDFDAFELTFSDDDTNDKNNSNIKII